MKKIVCILSMALLVVSLFGCQATLDEELVNAKESVEEGFDVILEETLEYSKVVYYHHKEVNFYEEYLIDYEIGYTEEENEDALCFKFIMADEAFDYRPYGEVVNEFLDSGKTGGGENPTITAFTDGFEYVLNDYFYDNNIDCNYDAVIEIYNESNELIERIVVPSYTF